MSAEHDVTKEHDAIAWA